MQFDKDFRNEVESATDYKAFISQGKMNEASVKMSAWRKKRDHEIKIVVAKLAVDMDLSEVQQSKIYEMTDVGYSKGMKKEYERNRRKIAETRALLDLLDKYKEDLKGIETYIDMAGGAGDLGLAIAEHFNEDGVKSRIIDVMPDLEDYNTYLKNVGLHPETADRVSFELHPLQETEIQESDRKQTAFVAKHPCGPLKDDIVSMAIDKEIPFVMIMTCCQDKICDHLDEFFPLYKSEDIPDKDTFNKILKNSGRTNINPEEFSKNPKLYKKQLKKREAGDNAMDLLDGASANRLRDAGYDVVIEKVGKGKINKGNVIVAVKRKK